MARVTYTPTAQDDAFAPTTTYGLTFKPGEAVPVDDALTIGDAKLNVVEKLRNNPQFTVEDDDHTGGQQASPPSSAEPVEIPAGWDDLHWMQQAKLAEQITGTRPATAAEAKAAIEAELVRRAAA